MLRRPEVEHRETTAATPAQVWAWYEHVEAWRRWDGGVSSVALEGPFASGTRGTITMPGGRRGRVELLDVEAGVAYTDRLRTRLLTVTTSHRLTPVAGGTEISHTVRLGGFLASLLPHLMTGPVRRSLPVSVGRLAFLATRESPA